MKNAGNTRGVVRCIRLKLTASEGLLKGKLFVHALVDGVGLVTICDDSLVSKHTDRRIDDQARVSQLARVKGLGTDALTVFHKNPVTAVFAAAHDKVGRHCLRAIRGLSNDNAPSRVCVCL